MRYGCENKVVGNRLCSGEELGGQPVFDCVGNVWAYVSSCAVGRGFKCLDDYHKKICKEIMCLSLIICRK